MAACRDSTWGTAMESTDATGCVRRLHAPPMRCKVTTSHVSFAPPLFARDRSVGTQGAFLFAHYCLLAALVPLPVAIGHVFLGGWLTATIVTVTHTAEEFSVKGQLPLPSSSAASASTEEGGAREPSYVETQFKTTRDAVCRDPLSE